MLRTFRRLSSILPEGTIKTKVMVYKEIIGRELYVYMNGSLLYKRWLDQDHGMIMDKVFGNFRPKYDR